MQNNNSNRPDIRAYIGTTGSGKGVSIRAHLKAEKPARFMVWDPLGEYGEFVTVTTDKLATVTAMVQKAAFRVAFYPGADPATFKDKFDMFCRIAFAAGNCMVLIEELSDVTKPSYAPLAWRRCTKQGRHRGLRIVAASQRPADVDKNFFGGCTYIRCFTLRYADDEKAMAAVMKVPLAEIQGLMTTEAGNTTTINYIERDFRERKTTADTIKLRR